MQATMNEPNSTPTPRYISSVEVAELIGVALQTVRNWCRAGRFPKPIRIGAHLLFVRKEVHDFLDANEKARYSSTERQVA